MTTLTLQDPSAFVRTPAADSDAYGQMIDEAKGNLGPIVRTLDWVIEKVLGFSPVEKICGPLIGDFNGVDLMRTNWKSASQALTAVGENYTAMAGAVPSTWRGDDARAAVTKLRQFASAHKRQGPPGAWSSLGGATQDGAAPDSEPTRTDGSRSGRPDPSVGQW